MGKVSVPIWPVRLDQPPEVVNVGVGRHGVHCSTERWVLPNLWSLHLYQYDGDLTVDHAPLLITAGSVSVVPPGTTMLFRYRRPSTHLFAHLRLPAGGARTHCLPAIGVPAGGTGPLTRLWEEAVAAFPTTPDRSRADMWGVLWRLAIATSGPVAEPVGHHPVVLAATGYLEMHLSEPVSVPELARAVGVSHTHLTRMFRQDLGRTVVGYIRRRRVEQAERLLRHSTLSVASIAAAVGIADLQAFNKAVRRELGCSPRAARAASATADAVRFDAVKDGPPRL